jgi:hypothetical protein
MKIKNGRAKFEKMDRDESWSVEGNNIVKTETEHGRIETTIFSDIDGDGVFAKMSKSYNTATATVNSTAHSTSGSDNDDLWRGNTADDHYDGGQGDDQVSGGNGNDELRGASGIDARSGNWSNDAFTYVGAAVNVTSANANGALWFENGILYGSNDRDTAAESQIELVGVTQLSLTDLVL